MRGRTLRLAILLPAPALLVAPPSLHADVVVIVSQARSVVTHASGENTPPAPPNIDDDAAQATDFGVFEQTVRSSALGMLSRGCAHALQSSRIDAGGLSGTGLARGEADSTLMDRPGIGRGSSAFEAVFEVPARTRFQLSASVGTSDDIPVGAPFTFATLTSSLILSTAAGEPLFAITADRFARSASVHTLLLIDPGQYRLTSAANANLTTLSTALPRMFVEATFTFTLSPAPCPADYNHDDLVNSQDLFGFLADFFAQAATADLNGDFQVDSQDFYTFLTLFFIGC